MEWMDYCTGTVLCKDRLGRQGFSTDLDGHVLMSWGVYQIRWSRLGRIAVELWTSVSCGIG